MSKTEGPYYVVSVGKGSKMIKTSGVPKEDLYDAEVFEENRQASLKDRGIKISTSPRIWDAKRKISMPA